ncbi:Immunoglobulin V-set domain, partial [Trinorchestia longiramus]
VEMVSVRVVAGNTATLPCSLDTREPEDSVQIVLWIKEGVHTPLYSYDYRELLGGKPKQTKPDTNSTLAQRTTFRTDAQPAALVVERVRSSDSGVYRCRVDFLMSPTRNSRVNLTVV